MAFLPQLPLMLAVMTTAISAYNPYFPAPYFPANHETEYDPNLRYSRSAPSGSAAQSLSSASTSSSTGTYIAPGPGGAGTFNAFAGTGPAYGPPSGGSTGYPGYPGYPGFPGYGYGYGYPSYIPHWSSFIPSFDFNRFAEQFNHGFQEAQKHAKEAAASNGASNEVGASAVGQYGQEGGYGSASVYPGSEAGLDSRFGGGEVGSSDTTGPVNSVSGSFPPPKGSTYGVFTSSSSGFSDIDGKKTSHKMSKVTINDNGKVTTYSAHDP